VNRKYKIAQRIDKAVLS